MKLLNLLFPVNNKKAQPYGANYFPIIRMKPERQVKKMTAILHFVEAHWLILTLFTGIAAAVAFVWSHKQRLFYNKPEP
jgi:hypothetical protein